MRALSIYVAEGNNCLGKTFKLTKNIVLTDTIEWNPIGDSTTTFRGTFDGAGYTVSGILISIKQNYAGFVGYLGTGGTIKDLTIANSKISIPPEVDNKIQNDLISSKTVGYSYLGAIAGRATSATISNCKNSTSLNGGTIVGGIVGRAENTTIEYCSNSGKVQSYRTVGGIVGSYDDTKTVVCHLGNGSSISAVLNGQSVDTSMGLTPLEGLVMGTRSGDIDPAILEFLAKKENLDINGLMNVLNKKSGVFGLSEGLSSDFRDLENAANEGNEAAARARSVFNYRVAKYIGAYAAAMNGVDVIVFTAGLGENDHLVREDICSYLGYLGVTLDLEANKVRGKEVELSTPDSKVKVMMVPTNEELAIARETLALVK